MGVIDWIIILLTLFGTFWLAIKTKGYMRGVSDFLAANRCAGRYLLCVAQGTAMLGAISIIAKFEMFYEAGFTASWWMILNSAVVLFIVLSGWVNYRYRETRAYTLSQFFEIRYSRGVRILTGIIGWGAGILNFGIFPAVGAKFFIYYCDLPETIPFIGGSTYAFTMFALLLVSLYFVFIGGQITVMVTEFAQGIFANIAMLIIIFLFFIKFNWADIMQTLQQAPQNASMLHPFKTSQLEDFNPFYFIILGLSMFYNRLTWQGVQGYACSAKNAHEAKMGSILGEWREIVSVLLMMLLPIAVYVVLHNAAFAAIAEPARSVLNTISNETIRHQVTVPVVLRHLFPVGIVGLFASVILVASISNHSSYLHSWGSIFIQDVVMPFRKTPFSPKQHLLLLKLSVLFVAVFIFMFSLVFRQSEKILMFLPATSAVFVGGAGSLVIGGLYWKRGSTKGAYVAMLAGSIMALGSIACRQFWVSYLYPWLAESAPALLNGLKMVLEGISSRVPGIHWKVGPDEFPISGQWVFFFTMIVSVSGYVLFSMFDWLILKHPAHNLNKLLHRGEYAIAGEHGKGVSKPVSGWRAMFPTSEFTFTDKLIYYFKLSWGLGWIIVFIIGVIINFTRDVPVSSWITFWGWKIGITVVVGVVTTIWFLIGGIRDVIGLFAALRNSQEDKSDIGFVKRVKD